MIGGSRSVLVVVGAVASSLGRSPSRGARGAAACGAALALLASAQSCRRARVDVALGRCSSVAAARSPGAVRSARRLALSACGRRRGRYLSGGDRRRAALTEPLPAAPQWSSWRRLGCAAALAAAWRSATTLPWEWLALLARCILLSSSRSLRFIVGAVASSLEAVAVARRARRCFLRRRAGAPGAGSVVPPRSLRRGARPPLFHGGGSLSWRGASCSTARTLCVWTSTRSLPLWGRSPSRGAHGAAACGAALALLAPAGSCRRARGGVALGRRFSVELARSLGAVRSARRLALSACGRWCGRFLAMAVAVLWRSLRRCLRRRAGAPSAGWVAPPRSRRRGARPPLFRGNDSLSWRVLQCSAARAPCVWSLVQSFPRYRRLPSYGAHCAGACGSALALLASARS